MPEKCCRSPPRMRGSTPGSPHGLADKAVSPAHAGIDPRARVMRERIEGLPRACGDRPLRGRFQAIQRMSPPRMRGSTCEFAWTTAPVNVSPAHAGIDPGLDTAPAPARSLPRACGDRPVQRWALHGTAPSPPRMRGSTWNNHIVSATDPVSPAHAGIDRWRRTSASIAASLPRACGDRPGAAQVALATAQSPPRMRGSTWGAALLSAPILVSPAHAGIDPWYLRPTACGAGLPRACGDRPHRRRIQGVIQSSPPRMRGSTRPAQPPAGDPAVSPAHAGIDLKPHLFRLARACLPRACGDRPFVGPFPGPSFLSPPRMRGSTRHSLPIFAPGTVSPAHAGIDPPLACSMSWQKGLPRACGDRQRSTRKPEGLPVDRAASRQSVRVCLSSPPRQRRHFPGYPPTGMI